MATTTYSRHPTSYASHQKSLPITMPSGKGPVYNYPTSRVADPPELSDTSTSYASGRSSGGSYSVRSDSSYGGSHHSGDYDSMYSRGPAPGIDVVDELADRMHGAFDPIRMDKSLAKQAQT